MTRPDQNTPKPKKCPQCGQTATRKTTRYGFRDTCETCNLWGWDGKPLVSKAVHDARQHCHAVFDPLWKTAETMYEIEEIPGSPDYEIAVKRIRKSARNRAYHYIADLLGIPEADAHMAEQEDIRILRRIYRAARDADPAAIRQWAKENPDKARSPKKLTAAQERLLAEFNGGAKVERETRTLHSPRGETRTCAARTLAALAKRNLIRPTPDALFWVAATPAHEART